MTTVLYRTPPTSAQGSMRRNRPLYALVGLSLCMGTASGVSASELRDMPARAIMQTTSGGELRPRRQDGGTPSRIFELRRLSGLTWEQLARALATSRRSLHYWANGGNILPENYERVGRTLAVLQQLNRGSAAANRDLLLGPTGDGRILLDLLTEMSFDRVLALAKMAAPPRAEAVSAALSATAMAWRKPPKPPELLDTLPDTLPVSGGKARAYRPLGRRARDVGA